MGVLVALRRAQRVYWIAIAFLLSLYGCGGGSTGAQAPELPQILAINTADERNAIGATVEFASNAVEGLSFQWQFGDGASSAQWKPKHAYVKAGVYTVQLTVANEGGSTRVASFVVTVLDLDPVRGKLCSMRSGAGWCWQRPLPQGNRIAASFYVDAMHGWSVGELGTLLTTRDGGVSWERQSSGTERLLTSVHFVNDQVGWVASEDGLVLRTNDGGAHWSAASIDVSGLAIRAIGAWDANTAWVTTSWPSLSVTQDGGLHWASVSYPTSVQSYQPVTTSDVWAVPYQWGEESEVLAHTIDAGVTWTTVRPPASTDGLSRAIDAYYFVDASHGWVTLAESGYSTSKNAWVHQTAGYRTADGGSTWQAFDAAPFQDFKASFTFIDVGTAFAYAPVGLKRSVDGGLSWQDVPVIEGSEVASIKAFSAQRILLRDKMGRTYLTFDSGAHWFQRGADGGSQPSFDSVWFFSSREGVAMGADGSSVRTTDGGQNWVEATPGDHFGWHRMQFLGDGSVGWVISATGVIYRSTDKGQSWNAQPVPPFSYDFVTDFAFVDSMNGWAVALTNTNAGVLFRTTDGGSSWQAIPKTDVFAGYQSLRFADAAHGVAVGPAGFALVTEDAGVTWVRGPTGVDKILRRVTFVDSQTVVAVGDHGTIVRSTDLGRTWAKAESPTTTSLTDVRFVSPKTGFAVGEQGTVLVTQDGGASWKLQATGLRANLRSIFLVDEQAVWTVGDGGTIIATVTGGQ